MFHVEHFLNADPLFHVEHLPVWKVSPKPSQSADFQAEMIL
jgi:hypothetical protein